jgi:hypothetical protein
MYFHEILFYDGEQSPPAYYLIDGIEAVNPKDAFAHRSPDIVNRVREVLNFGSEISDEKILDALYILKKGGLVSASAAKSLDS